MSEIKHSEIVYEEGWRENTPVVTVDDEPPVDEAPATEPAPEVRTTPKPLLITVQLVLCLIAALALFLLKSMDSGFYHDFMDYYHDELRKPVISQQIFESIDEGLFGSALEATGDEAAPR